MNNSLDGDIGDNIGRNYNNEQLDDLSNNEDDRQGETNKRLEKEFRQTCDTILSIVRRTCQEAKANANDDHNDYNGLSQKNRTNLRISSIFYRNHLGVGGAFAKGIAGLDLH